MHMKALTAFKALHVLIVAVFKKPISAFLM